MWIYANLKRETQKKMYFEVDNLDFWNNVSCPHNHGLLGICMTGQVQHSQRLSLLFSSDHILLPLPKQR